MSNPITDHVANLLVLVRRRFFELLKNEGLYTQDQMMDALQSWAANRTEFLGYSGEFLGSSKTANSTEFVIVLEITHDLSTYRASVVLDTSAANRMVFTHTTEMIPLSV